MPSLARHHPRHHLADGKRCREPGALDAIEGDKATLPMNRWAMDGKIRHRFARSVEFGTDARVVGVKALDLQAGIVAADAIEELAKLLRLKAVIYLWDPGDVRPELAAAAHVHGGMQPEPGAIGHGIDVALEGRPAGQRIILPLGIVGLWRPIL